MDLVEAGVAKLAPEEKTTSWRMWPLGGLAAVIPFYLASALVIPIHYDFPLVDEPIYAERAFRYANTGVFEISELAAPNVLRFLVHVSDDLSALRSGRCQACAKISHRPSAAVVETAGRKPQFAFGRERDPHRGTVHAIQLSLLWVNEWSRSHTFQMTPGKIKKQ